MSNLEALSAFQPTKFLLDASKLSSDERADLARLLRDTYKNQIESSFFAFNPVVIIQSDYGSVSRIVEELNVPRSCVSKKVRDTASSSLETLQMMADDYQSFTWDQFKGSPRGQVLMTANPDETIVEVIQGHITGLDDETFVELKDDIALKVRTEVATNSRAVANFKPEMLTRTVESVVNDVVTRESLRKAVGETEHDLGKEKITRQGIPTKTEASVVTSAVDCVLDKLGQVTLFLASQVAAKIDAKPTQVKEDSTPKLLPKLEYQPPVAPRLKRQLAAGSLSDTEVIVKQVEDLSFNKPKQKSARQSAEKRSARKRLQLDSDSDDSEDYAEDVIVDEKANISSYDANKEVDRIDAKSLPIWRHGETVEERYFRLEEYISDLKAFQTLGYNVPPARVIYSSLNASNRMHQRRDFPPEALTDFDKFIKFLRKSYGRTELALRQQLNNFQRKSDENIFSYYQRLLSLYWNVRRKDPMTDDELKKKGSDGRPVHQEVINDLFHYFLRGLNNKKLEQNLRMQLSNLDLFTLARDAQDMENAMLMETEPVHAVETVEKPLTEATLAAALNKVHAGEAIDKPLTEATLVAALQKVLPTGQDNTVGRARQIVCYFCGKIGHYARDCRSRLNQTRRQKDTQPGDGKNRGSQEDHKNHSESTNEQQDGKRRMADIICYRCGLRGHVAATCRVNLGKKLKR